MRAMILQFIRYALVSALALTIDVALLSVLVTFAGWHYLIASALSFVAGGVVAYLLCVRFVFEFRRIENTTLELPYFVLLGLIGLVVNSLTMYTAVDRLGLHFLLAKLAASCCTVAVNFLLRRHFLFSPLESRLGP